MKARWMMPMVIVTMAISWMVYSHYEHKKKLGQQIEDLEELDTALQIVDTAKQLSKALENNDIEEARVLVDKLKNQRENLPPELQELSEAMKVTEENARDVIRLMENNERMMEEINRKIKGDSP